MKKLNIRSLLCLALLMLGFAATAQEVRNFTFNHEGKTGIQMIEQTRGNVALEYNLDAMSLTSFTYNGEEMQNIGIADISLPNEKGLPNVPNYSRTIAIPQGAQAVLHVVSYEQQVIDYVNVEPSLGVQMENEEPDMNYIKDMKVYAQNEYYPAEFASISEPSQIRGVDVVNISISPVRFNPVTKKAIVYHNIELAVEFVGGNGQFGDNRLRSPYFDPILAQNIMNYEALPTIDYEARMQQWLRDGDEGAEYIIVIPNNDGFVEPATRLRDFRMAQGILTEVVKLQDMPATTTDQMKTYFHNAYDNWDIAPVAVLLFGDHNTNMAQGIPAITVSHPYNGSCITDIQYADMTGNDNLPEIVFSRLVAADATEANMMADKQIEYEFTNPNMDASFYNAPVTALGWQTERWFQLCSEVFGGYMRAHGYNPQRINCIYDGTPGSSWSSAQNTAQVTSYFGPSGTNYIPASPAELGGWTGGSPEQVVNAVNAGTFWVQHRDHGLNEGWGEPAVRNTHIDQLNNVGKMPFVMSINCQTGMFNYTGSNGNCFTEKWMRRTYNGQNAGAVGVLSPTEVSYSFVNDAFVWGVYDQFDPNFMPTYPTNTNHIAYANRGNWRPAFGNVAGKYFLQETSWPYNTGSKEITYIMFTAHCDAFLRIYTQVPQTMAVNHQNVQLAGLNTFQITAPEGATIALTKGEGEDLEIVAVATATGSVQNVEIAPQTPPTVLHLTITGQNYLRYESDIDVIPAAGPYLIINEYELINAATQLNFGEESGLDIQLKNVGNSQAPAGTATLSTESEYITITDGTEAFTAINSNATLDLSNAFSFTVSDEVPNKTLIDFVVTITSGSDTYESHIAMKAYAPEFAIGSVTITEIDGNGNGRLDPGETVKLTFPIENKGNADSWATDATLTLNNNFMTLLTEPVVTVNSIAASNTANVEYQIYVGNAPSGFAAEYTLDVASGVYTDSRDFMSKIGLNVEDFESGTLDPSMWNNSSAIPWAISNDQPYEGTYCVKSGAISHSSDTDLILTYEVGENDSIAFYYKVSSESGYDKLFFYIDNVEKNNWSGTVAWSRAQYAVTAGTHTFKWQYHKDSSVSSGSDCAWIDYVILPRDRSLAVNAGLDMAICEGSDAQLDGFVSNQTSMEWSTSGDGTFSDIAIVNPVYTPGNQDIANGGATLTLTAHKDNETMSDDMELSFLAAPTVELLSGNDALACMGVIDITGFYAVENAETVELTTNGDGTFEGNVYTFGTQDIANGNAQITITAIGCGEASASLLVGYQGVPTAIGPNEISTCTTEPIDVEMTLDSNWGALVGWTTTGTGTINDPTSENIVFTPSEEDFNNGTVTLTAEYTDCEGTSYFHVVTVNFTMPTVPMPQGPQDVHLYNAVTEYTVDADASFTSFDWTLAPADAAISMVPSGNTVTITWDPNTNNGEVLLTVVGHSETCGDSEPSEALVITLRGASINEINAANINIHPNPTNDFINVAIENVTSNIQVVIYNSVGQVVYSQNDKAENGYNAIIDLGELSSGTYTLQVRSEENVWTNKIIKR